MYFRFLFLVFFVNVFSASGLLGFSAFGLSAFGFSASGLFGFLLVYAAFGGFLALAFRILCIPSSSSPGGILAFAAFRWFMRLLAALAFRILCFPSSSRLFGFCTLSLVVGFGFPHHQQHQLLPNWIITSSNIMGGASPPQPTREKMLQNTTFWVICVIHVCLYVCTSSNIIGEDTPANPPAA